MAPTPSSLDAFKRSTTPSKTARRITHAAIPTLDSLRRPVSSSSSQAKTGSTAIARLSRPLSATLRSAQTILDISAIVKELIENALDAGATQISIRLNGKTPTASVVVSDNGRGIAREDHQTLCEKSTTSKIDSWSDMANLTSYGFRGEALSAICNLSKAAIVTTRTEADRCATELKYEPDGRLADSRRVARTIGTSIQVEDVFNKFPVRKKDALKNASREIARCVSIVQAFALGCAARMELRISKDLKVSNNASGHRGGDMSDPNTCLSVMRTNAVGVLGGRIASQLIEVSSEAIAKVSKPSYVKDAEGSDEATYECHALVSAASLNANGSGGRARSSHQYVFLNDRPVDFSRLTRPINDLYRRATGLNGASPVLVMMVRVPAWCCDINLAPDKKSFCVHDEPQLIGGILKLLESSWMPTTEMHIPVRSDGILDDFMTKANAERKGVSRADHATRTASSIVERRERIYANNLDSFAKGAPDNGQASHASIRNADRAVRSFELQDREKVEEQVDAAGGTGDASLCDNDVAMKDLETTSVPGANEGLVSLHDVPPMPQDDDSDGGEDDCSNSRDQSKNNETSLRASDMGRKGTNTEARRALSPVTPPSSEKPPLAPLAVSQTVPTSPDVVGPKAAAVEIAQATEAANRHLLARRETLRVSSLRPSSKRNVASFVSKRAKMQPAKRPRLENALASYTRLKTPRIENAMATQAAADTGAVLQAGEVDNSLVIETVYDTPPTKVPESLVEEERVVRVNWEKQCAAYVKHVAEKRKQSPLRTKLSAGVEQDDTFAQASIAQMNEHVAPSSHHQAADREMSRLFKQEWFKELEVLGQFNRGFIICRLGQDLFIIDQHASDEKYNFEELQRTTMISKQRLVRPMSLQFSAEDELVVLQHLDAFRAGGFDIDYRANNRPTQRLYLKAQPSSKNTIFVCDDLQEIVDMLKSSTWEGSAMQVRVLRPPRIRAMFASRACRKSIMIGTALKMGQMRNVVRNLASIQHPWTCPHGRPTMRHLCTMPSYSP